MNGQGFRKKKGMFFFFSFFLFVFLLIVFLCVSRDCVCCLSSVDVTMLH